MGSKFNFFSSLESREGTLDIMSEEKKLHIDEDWKSQVDREKELLRNPSAASESVPASAQTVEPTERRDEVGQSMDEEADELPPASMIILISSLASQAMAAMGQLPGGDGKPLPVSLPFARHFIDLLGVLEDKTRNNLTAEETGVLNNSLHHLRLMFVECSRRK